MPSELAQNLKLLMQSGNSLVSIETNDEQRATKIVLAAASLRNATLYDWSMTRGLRKIGTDGVPGLPTVEGPKAAATLDFIEQNTEGAIYVVRDFAPHCKDAFVVRMIRDLESTLEQRGATIIFLDSTSLPDDVRRLTVRFDVGWPTTDEIEQVIKQTFQKIRRNSDTTVMSTVTKRDAEQMVQTLRGLSLKDVGRVVAAAIYDDFALTVEDLPRLVEAKRTLLGNLGSLEDIAVDFSVDYIGGLRNLKGWLRQRRGGFSRQAREYGIEPPRGVLMLGVPGCGKSLCAKVVASDWNMPLLRLDPGVLYQKFIGESESQLRQALLQAESMAPVVLWIDEIEKAFASASGDSSDGGLSQRMFGTLLSWMQDHRHPIFIVATANDISALPPELMRKGRFDEVFFVDLPSEAARGSLIYV
ncbi:MAG: AAA family ATPase [Planctomycetota bacterium]|nr:AAA family ATPase [Planctomycetota bacterium]